MESQSEMVPLGDMKQENLSVKEVLVDNSTLEKCTSISMPDLSSLGDTIDETLQKKDVVIDATGTDHEASISILSAEENKRKRAEPIVCTICSNETIKYRCPRCERITCSLGCCLLHKKTFDCDGKRDRTKYIPMAEFQDADMSSDFFFLQEISRSTSAVRLDVAVKPPPQKKSKRQSSKATQSSAQSVNPELPADYLRRFPQSVQVFVHQAKKRGVSVHLHAPGMSKHKSNTSNYNSKSNSLNWRLELQFVGSNARIIEPKWSEERSLLDLIEKNLNVSLENTPLRAKLKAFCKLSPSSDWIFLLRKEFEPASTPLYYELDPSASIASNLANLSIVEFPIICVDLASNRHNYSIAHRPIEIVAEELKTTTNAPPLPSDESVPAPDASS